MKKRNTFSGLMSATVLAAGLGATPALSADITITMAAPDWPPTRFMKEPFDQTYTSPAGHTTTLDMDFIPWPSFYERVAASLTSGECDSSLTKAAHFSNESTSQRPRMKASS